MGFRAWHLKQSTELSDLGIEGTRPYAKCLPENFKRDDGSWLGETKCRADRRSLIRLRHHSYSSSGVRAIISQAEPVMLRGRGPGPSPSRARDSTQLLRARGATCETSFCQASTGRDGRSVDLRLPVLPVF